MNASETLDKLIPALVQAKSKFDPIHKDKHAKIGTYSYSYADLASVLDAITPALSANGLALVQPLTFDGSVMVLETRLLHTSGQWIGGTYPVPMASKAQELGSAITYGRRYSITALLGIVADDDDDGAAASQDKPRREAKGETKPAPVVLPEARPSAPATVPDAITEKQRAELRSAALAVFGTGYISELKRLMKEVAGADDSLHLDQSGFTLVRTAIQVYADQQAVRTQ